MTESVLDRLERLHRESTEDGGNQSFQIMQGGIYINELEVNAPDLMAAVRSLGSILTLSQRVAGHTTIPHDFIEEEEGADIRELRDALPAALAAWEKVGRDG